MYDAGLARMPPQDTDPHAPDAVSSLPPRSAFRIGVVPVLFGLLVLTAALLSAARLRHAEERNLDRVVAGALHDVTTSLERRLESQVDALEGFAERLQHRELLREEWEHDARVMVDHYGTFQAVEWVDPEFRVRWVVPLEGNEPAVGLDLGFEERRRVALERARDGGETIVTRPVDLVQGGKGFLVYAPVVRDGHHAGFLLGVYRVDVLFTQILAGIAPGFEIRAAQGDEALFARGVMTADATLAQRQVVQVRNQHWGIEVAPGPAVVATYLTWIPFAAAAGGGLYAVVLGLVTYLARSRRLRAAELLEANARLREEMARRERAEVGEQEASRNLTAVVEAFPDHVWSALVTPERGFETQFYSPAIERISGYAPAWFRDEPNRWIDCVDAADRERVRLSYQAVVSGAADGASLEYRIKRADGELRWVRDRIRVAHTSEGRQLHGVISDITEMRHAEEERRQLETKVQETQRLESLGVLAGGIAHDFNNLLVGALGHAHLALRDLPPGSPVRRNLERIERAATRAAELCHQMLAYAGQAAFETAPLDLAETVEEIGDLFAASIAKKVTLRYDFEPDLPLVNADATQIRQVILNLITNASEAIGDRRGTILVSTRAVICDRAALDAADLSEDLEPGRHVRLRVKDDGCGMNEETRRRFFEPFFSTKFAGRGLGMAAVLGIVRSHRGAIRVESVVGQGTSISLLFPALPRDTERPRPAPTPAPGWRGSGTILLVDDEEDARELGSLVLERAGFRVLTASDGEEGVSLFERHADEIACVVLDLTMPRLDGGETHRRLRALRPGVPVVLCSGYPEREAIERFTGLGLSGFLKKPYTPEELVDRVRVALEATARGD